MNANTENKFGSVRSAIRIAIATSLFLAAFKFTAGCKTHSLAIMASALDSLMDAGMSIVNYIAVKEASKPPDKEHEYGHGKIESLAGLFQSSLIMIGGLFLVTEAMKRLISGEVLLHPGYGAVVMSISLAITFILVQFLRKKAKKSGSLIMQAEKVHFASDVFAGVGIIGALALAYVTKMPVWDLVFSLVIAAWIFRSSFRILKQSIDELLDRSLPAATREKIEKIILSYDGRISGLHEFRSHKVGRKIFLDFHLEIRDIQEFTKAHEVTEGLISRIQGVYPGADVTIHYDPQGED